MSVELKPCPFCGGEAEFETYGDTACAVTCRKCRCGTPTVSLNDGERAVEAWNRRAERTCHYVYDKEICAWRCSECGGLEPVGDHVRYCPDCGARIAEEVSE